jgi:hypothetical protein
MAIEKKVDKDDLLSRLRIKETLLFGLITIAALFANLPQETLEDMGVNQGYLLALLLCGVVVGLFFYLKFFFFLAVVLLIAGANMPAQIAEGFGISKAPIILALVAMVGIALINTIVKLMPTGLEPKPKERSPEGVRAMFYAIEKGNLVYAQKVLGMNFDPNVVHENGYTPLTYAAAKGHTQMVELFLRNGADPTLPSKDGDTPIELALRFGHSEVAETLKRARQGEPAGAEAEPAAA